MFNNQISLEIVLSIILVLVLLLLSAFISGSEIAYFSFGATEEEELSASEHIKDIKILDILSEKKKLLATILISNNFVNVGIIIISNFIISSVLNFGNNKLVEVLINVVIVTTFLVFFGEVMPKILASKKNIAFARITLPIIQFFMFTLVPFSFLLTKFGRFLDSKIEKKKDIIDLDEIEKAIDLGVDDDTKEKDKKLLKGIVHFGNTTVKQIMKPRVDIVAINSEKDFEAVLELIKQSGYSRIPVYEENIDKIIGILYIKDLLAHLSEPKTFKWKKMLRNPDFTSETKKIDDLLREMQESKLHMSIVADEYGGTLGLITLEDILEEVVGEINDEFDKTETQNFKKNDDGSYLFLGKTPLIDVCKAAGIEMGSFEDEKGESGTLAGLILETIGQMPIKGQTININEFEFKIIEIGKNRINKINLKINEKE